MKIVREKQVSAHLHSRSQVGIPSACELSMGDWLRDTQEEAHRSSPLTISSSQSYRMQPFPWTFRCMSENKNPDERCETRLSNFCNKNAKNISHVKRPDKCHFCPVILLKFDCCRFLLERASLQLSESSGNLQFKNMNMKNEFTNLFDLLYRIFLVKVHHLRVLHVFQAKLPADLALKRFLHHPVLYLPLPRHAFRRTFLALKYYRIPQRTHTWRILGCESSNFKVYNGRKIY